MGGEREKERERQRARTRAVLSQRCSYSFGQKLLLYLMLVISISNVVLIAISKHSKLD